MDHRILGQRRVQRAELISVKANHEMVDDRYVICPEFWRLIEAKWLIRGSWIHITCITLANPGELEATDHKSWLDNLFHIKKTRWAYWPTVPLSTFKRKSRRYWNKWQFCYLDDWFDRDEGFLMFIRLILWNCLCSMICARFVFVLIV